MEVITVISTILSVVAAIVTIIQAIKVKSYKDQVTFDLRKIHLVEITDNLKRAQEEGRKLITQFDPLNRGKNITSISENIQSYIDNSLNFIHLKGQDNDIREKIIEAQAKLRDSQKADNQENRRDCVSEMHTCIQDAISLSKERIVTLQVGAKNE